MACTLHQSLTKIKFQNDISLMEMVKLGRINSYIPKIRQAN